MGLSFAYSPTTYPNGILFEGPDETAQENKIDAACFSMEGPGRTGLQTLVGNYNQIQAVKGAPWAAWMNLALHETRIGVLEVDTSALQGQMTHHEHDVADIRDNAILARQSSLISLAGEAEPFTYNVVGNAAGIATNAADIIAVKGTGWASFMTLVQIFDLMTNPTLPPPGHQHVVGDISGIDGLFVAQAQLDLVKGSAWTVAKNLTDIWNLLTNPQVIGPGHGHRLSDISGLGDFVTRTEFDALKGIGYIPSMTVADAYTQIDAMKGVGWNAAMNLAVHNAWLTSLDADTSALDVRLTALQETVTDLQGSGYKLEAGILVNVTGVTLTHPGAGGTPEGSYTFSFIKNPGGYDKIQWDGGVQVDIDSGDGTYTVFDSSTVTYINAYVRTSELPNSTTSDTNVEVFPQNVAHLYELIDDVITGGDLTGHILGTHGNALVTVPTFTVNVGNRNVVYADFACDLNGVRRPSTGGLSGNETLSAPAATKARVDIFSINSVGVVVVTEGVEFPVAQGIVYFPPTPGNSVLAGGIYVSGDRVGLLDSDVLSVKQIMDWKARAEVAVDALDADGEGADCYLGYSIEQARLIQGLTLQIDRLFEIQQPSNVTGVVLDQLDDTDAHVSFYGTSSPNFYDLEYDFTAGPNRQLRWGAGAWVDVTAGGTFTLLDSSGVRGIKAVVTPGSMPGIDRTDVGLSVGSRPTVGLGRYDISFEASTKNVTFDGGTPTNVDSVGLHHVPNANGKYVGVWVGNTSTLPGTDISDKVRVHYVGMKENDRKMVELLRYVNEQSTSAGTAGRSFTIGIPFTTGDFWLNFGSGGETIHYDSTTDSFDISGTLRTWSNFYGDYFDLFQDQYHYFQGDELHLTDQTDIGNFRLHTDYNGAVWPYVGGPAFPAVDWNVFAEWSSDETTMQRHDVLRTWGLPGDYAEQATPLLDSFGIIFSTDTTNPADNYLDAEVWNAGAGVPSNQGNTGPFASDVAGVQKEQGFFGNINWTLGKPDDRAIIRLRMHAMNSHWVRIHRIWVRYKRFPNNP